MTKENIKAIPRQCQGVAPPPTKANKIAYSRQKSFFNKGVFVYFIENEVTLVLETKKGATLVKYK